MSADPRREMLEAEAERLEAEARRFEEAGDEARAADRRDSARACRNSAEAFAWAAREGHLVMTVTVPNAIWLTRPPRRRLVAGPPRALRLRPVQRARTQRRRRGGAVRSGCSPGRSRPRKSDDPEPPAAADLAPPLAFDSFLPGLRPAVRCRFFGLLPDDMQARYWKGLALQVEAEAA